MSRRWQLVALTVTGVLLAPWVALIIGAGLPGWVAAAATMACGLAAAAVVVRIPATSNWYHHIRSAHPSQQFQNQWDDIAYRNKKPSLFQRLRRRNSEPDEPTQVARTGLRWLLGVLRLTVSYAWAANRNATIAAGCLLTLLIVAPLTPIPGVAGIGQAAALYVVTVALFTGATLLTEHPPQRSDG